VDRRRAAAIAYHAAAVAAVVLVAALSTIAHAQTTTTTTPLFRFTCPEGATDTLRAAFNFLNLLSIMVPAVILVLFILLHLFESFSPVFGRLEAFFSERLMTIVAIIIIMIMFFYNLGSQNIVKPGTNNCPCIDLSALFTQGPFIYRILGGFLGILGFEPGSTCQ